MQTKPFEELGSRIREARRGAGLTQEALAELIGAQKNTVSEIERGREPSLSVLGRIASALNVSMADLLTTTSSPMPARATTAMIDDAPAETPERIAQITGYAEAVLEMMRSVIAAQERVVTGLRPLVRSAAGGLAPPADDLSPPVSREKLDATVRRQLAKDAEEERPRRQKAAG